MILDHVAYAEDVLIGFIAALYESELDLPAEGKVEEVAASFGLPARCRWKWELCFFRCRKLCPHTNDWGRNGYISRINKSLPYK